MSLLTLDGETLAGSSLGGVTGGDAVKAGEATLGAARRPLFAPTGEGPEPIALKQLRAEAEHVLGQQESLDQWKQALSRLERNLAAVQMHLADIQARRDKLPPEHEKEHVALEKTRVELEHQIAEHRAQAERSRHAIEAAENRAHNVHEGGTAEAQRVIEAVEAFNVAQEAVTQAHEEVERTTAVFDNFAKYAASKRHGAVAFAEHDIVIARSRLSLAEAERERAVDGLRFLDGGNAPPMDLRLPGGPHRGDDQAPHAQPVRQEPSPTSVAKGNESIVVRTTAGTAGPYRSSPQLPDRDTHPLIQRLLEQYPTALSAAAEGRLNAFVYQLSDLDTHPPVFEGLAKLAIVVEQDSFPPTELLQLLGELHDVWRPDGIHADSTDAVLTLLNRTKKQIDASYTLGFKALPIIPLVILILYVTGVPPLISGGVLSTLAIAVAIGTQVLQLINHRRKDLDEMRADLKKLLPPLKREKLPPASSRQLPQETSSND